MRVYLQEAFEKIAADEAIGDAQFAAINAAKLDALMRELYINRQELVDLRRILYSVDQHPPKKFPKR